MPMDPAVEAMLGALAEAYIPALESAPVHQIRLHSAATRQSWLATHAPKPVHAVSDLSVPGPAGEIALRVYHPVAAQGGQKLPVVAYFHGGGFVMGDLESHDEACRVLARNTQCIVVAADYRLAPENPFPAASDDCLAVAAWIGKDGGDIGANASRMVLAGDSAGGNLAAVTALRLRDEGGPAPLGQVLIYPMTDHYRQPKPSLDENGVDCGLTALSVRRCWDLYLTDSRQAAHPWASPLQAGTLAGLPPALVVTAECDPLRDEGEMYARRLAASGVETTLTRYLGMIHGFDHYLPSHPASVRLRRQVADWVRARLLSAPSAP